MNIGINLTDLIPRKIGGMENYMRSVIHDAPKLFPKDEFYIFIKKEVWDTFNCNDKNIKTVFIDWNNRKELSTKLSEQIITNNIEIWLSMLLILDPIDIEIPKAFTIPDMQHEHYPEFFTKEILEWRRKFYKLSADKADLIFTISKDSKKDIIKYLNIPESKIKVTYLDAPPWFYTKTNKLKKNQIKKKYNLPEKYIFYPANTWPHKNHIRLFKAIKKLKTEGHNIKLVLTGYANDADKKVKKEISKLSLKDNIKFLGYIDRKDMPYIYQNSELLVFPSLFEGFGIPIIEAMRSKCPVICSKNTSLPEVGGNAVIYFNPKDSKNIADKILLVYNDKNLQKSLIEKGIKQAEKFSTKKCTKETIEVLKELKKEKDKLPKNPLISIIIPSYNQGKFIERTIKSIINQNYDNFEIIIMDGGSKDNSVNIIKKYAKKFPNKIIWESEKDKGQTDAINKGLKIAKGEIMAYLNSDDTYTKNTFTEIINFFSKNQDQYFVYGVGHHIDKNDKYIENYPNGEADKKILFNTCPICQPTTFWRRKIINTIGLFSEKLNFAMDYDYWIKISKHFKLNYINKHLANTRFYDETKTSGQSLNAHKEILNVIKNNYGKVSNQWIYGYAHVYVREKLKIKRDNKFNNIIFRILIILISSYKFLRYNKRIPKSAFKRFKEWM